MFAFTLMAIPVDNDVGLQYPSSYVYLQPEQVVSPIETVITVPSGFVNEFYRQVPNVNSKSVKGVDYGSINRFVLIDGNKTINSPKLITYNGFSFGCVNKLL
jgi:hypothetical protein